VTIREVFGEDVSAVCVIDNFLVEAAVLRNSRTAINVPAFLDRVRHHRFDSDTKSVYVLSPTQEIRTRYQIQDLDPAIRIAPSNEAMACNDPATTVLVHRGPGGGIWVRFIDMQETTP
jgi:hypothetical protein